MPRLLDLYSKYNIKSTFFFTGYIAKLIPDIVKMIIKDGHEVASHGMSHLKENGFDIMPLEKQIRHLKNSKSLLEDISGNEVISFRAPALRVNQDTVIALTETGYKIDSSVSPQRFDFFFSFGSINKLKWLSAPRLPYRTSPTSLFKKGNSKIVEIPISALLVPYIGTTLRIFPFITKISRQLLDLENNLNGKPIVFLIHPNELINEYNESRKINSRSNNPITFIIQDYLRSKLKTKNLGEKGIELYSNEVDFFINKNYRTTTLKDYYQSVNL
jgi:peptidoglycan/xylan/chitin deacetylase (PgdA/CDA1 family)